MLFPQHQLSSISYDTKRIVDFMSQSGRHPADLGQFFTMYCLLK